MKDKPSDYFPMHFFVVVVIYRNSPFVRQHWNVSKDRQGDIIAVLENKLSERKGAIWEEPDSTLHSISVINQKPESQI